MTHTMDTWQEFLKARDAGGPVEIDEEVFMYWLEVLPPVYMNQKQTVCGVERKCSFGFAEGFETVTDFWREGSRYFCQRSRRQNPHA